MLCNWKEEETRLLCQLPDLVRNLHIRVTSDDVMALADLPLVKSVSPEFMQEFPIVRGNKQSSHLVRGVAASYGVMRSEKAQTGGRFIDDEDVRLRRRVAFIGTEVQRKLFGDVPSVG